MKVALVTGAASGIGRATALCFARSSENYQVIVSDANETSLQETIDELKLTQSKQKPHTTSGCSSYVADISKEDQVQGLINHIKSEYGRLDAAFNCAGIAGTMNGTLRCSLENWQQTLDVNLTGVFLCCKYEAELMLETLQEKTVEEEGYTPRKPHTVSIVNCSSVAGKSGFPLMPAYCASKHGVIGLTKSMALEFAKKGIRANAVCPGVIDTAMIKNVENQEFDTAYVLEHKQPIGRMGLPQEVGDAVVWLCSDEASMVTGTALDIDGGWLAG